VLTGASLALMNALDVKLGFTFSAGAFDYVLSYGISRNGWMALVVGAAYFAIYYFVFAWAIRRFNLLTLGREAPADVAAATAPAMAAAGSSRALAYVAGLGGKANLTLVEACATRLRVLVKESARVDEGALKAAGARGVIRPSDGSVHVVIGPTADAVADEINDELKRAAHATA
jgi:PTS system N-acetylglucosamine-specific IIC component